MRKGRYVQQEKSTVIFPSQLPTRADVLRVARSMIGIPFVHQGRTRQGLDCIGLIVLTASELGYGFEDYTKYEPWPDGETIPRIFGSHAGTVEEGKMQPGDVLTFWTRKRGWINHAAILSEYGIIHTMSTVGRVVENGWDPRWRKRIDRVYTYPKVRD